MARVKYYDTTTSTWKYADCGGTVNIDEVSVQMLNFIETLEEAPKTIYTPFLDREKGRYITGTSVTQAQWDAAGINTARFFSTPWFFNAQNADSETYAIFTALGGNYKQTNEYGIEPGKYYFYVPFYLYDTQTLRVLTSTYSLFSEAVANDSYEVITNSNPVKVSEDLPLGSSDNQTYHLFMYEIEIPEGKYGYIITPHSVSYSQDNNGFSSYMHLSTVPLDNPGSYTETSPISFSDTVKKYYFGVTEDGQKLMDGLREQIGGSDNSNTNYPINTYNKTYVLGGDSGTSYGATVIEETISGVTGAVGTVRSVAGTKFTDTVAGGGLWFVDQYHDTGYPDIVCLCWGGNFDSGGVGSVEADYMEDGTTTPTTTLGALRYIVQDIRTVSPDTVIIGWIPYQMNLDGSWESRKTVYDQIREGYKLLGIPIIDAFNESGIVPRDMMDFDGGGIGSDQGHPSSYGQKRLAKLIANTIIRYA